MASRKCCPEVRLWKKIGNFSIRLELQFSLSSLNYFSKKKNPVLWNLMFLSNWKSIAYASPVMPDLWYFLIDVFNRCDIAKITLDRSTVPVGGSWCCRPSSSTNFPSRYSQPSGRMKPNWKKILHYLIIWFKERPSFASMTNSFTVFFCQSIIL